MSDITVVVKPLQKTNVTVQEVDPLTVNSTVYNSTPTPRLGDIGDVSAPAPIQNGSVLVYKTSTNRWTATTTLDEQNMEGGEF